MTELPHQIEAPQILNRITKAQDFKVINLYPIIFLKNQEYITNSKQRKKVVVWLLCHEILTAQGILWVLYTTLSLTSHHHNEQGNNVWMHEENPRCPRNLTKCLIIGPRV